MTFDPNKALLFSMMGPFYSPGTIPCGRVDSFQSSSGVDWTRSSGAFYQAPAYTCVEPTRSRAATMLNEQFEGTLSSWSKIVTGSAAVALVTTSNPDPAIGKVLDLQTGGSLASVAGVQKTLPAIPSTFGVMILSCLVQVGTDSSSALNLIVQTANGALFLRFNDNLIAVNLSGNWVTLYPHGGNYFTEVWVECVDKGDGTHDVDLYLGTQLVGSANGVLWAGFPGQANTVTLSQQSVGTANRHSQVAQICLGVTQLADAMTVVSTGRSIETTYSPVTAALAILVEDVSWTLLDTPGTLCAAVSKDDGATWTTVPLTVARVPGGNPLQQAAGFHGGELDTQKYMVLATGDVALPPNGGCNMRWQVQTSAGTFYPLQSVTMYWG